MTTPLEVVRAAKPDASEDYANGDQPARVAKSAVQNSLVHTWFRQITNYMNRIPDNNYDEETIKTYLKRRFGIRDMVKDPITREPMPVLKSLAKYDKGEMQHFMNQIEVFAAEIGCDLLQGKGYG